MKNLQSFANIQDKHTNFFYCNNVGGITKSN